MIENISEQDVAISTNNSAMQSLRLFQIISPSLPIGAFTYSQGMEWAVEEGWIKNQVDCEQWLHSLLTSTMARLELPIMRRLYQSLSVQDITEFRQWSQFLLSCRETAELRAEEQQRAQAFLRFLQQLPDFKLVENETHLNALSKTQSAGFVTACYQWNIPIEQCLLGHCWSWLENMINCAIKLVPLGQTQGQAMLHQLGANVPAIIDQSSVIGDEHIGASASALAIASSLHETQYCRLYRS